MSTVEKTPNTSATTALKPVIDRICARSASLAEANSGARNATALPTICQVLHGLPVGGAEVLAARVARQLQDKYRFVFACLDQIGALGEQLRSEGFDVTLLERQPGFDWSCSRRLAQILRANNVQLIHAHQYTPFFYAMLGRLFRGLPVLFTEHGRWFPDYPRRKRIVFNRLLLRRRDRVVGVGECVRQALVHNEGIRAHRVEVVYNGIETRAFPPRRVHRDQVRAELGCRPDEFVVIQVARLDYLKDHQTALRTLDRLVESVPAARLLLVGDGPERTAIEAEINCHQLWSNVSLLGTRHDVPRLLAAADVLLLTSISEGIPLTLLEAMAAGLPVVATRVGGVAEVVVDGETGLLAASGDDAALAAALRQLAQEPGLRQRLGACGCQRVRDHFDDAAMLTSYDQIYREMLGA